MLYTDFNFDEYMPIDECMPIFSLSYSSPVEKDFIGVQCDDYFNATYVTKSSAAKRPDFRPKIRDALSDVDILIDTGAMVSVWPSKYCSETLSEDTSFQLEAVNHSKLKTFGRKTRQIQIGSKLYEKSMIIADIPMLILGWDFLRQNQLDIVWNKSKAYLKDKVAGVSCPLTIGLNYYDVPHQLAPVGLASNDGPPAKYKSFQQWAQNMAQKAPKEPPNIPPKYAKLLGKFPHIQKADFKTQDPLHGIVHHIDTGNHPPCTAKMRPLMPGTPMAVQGEKCQGT